jgi:hypothetical protein
LDGDLDTATLNLADGSYTAKYVIENITNFSNYLGDFTWAEIQDIYAQQDLDFMSDPASVITDIQQWVIDETNDTPTGSVMISGTAAEDQTLYATSTLVDTDGLGELSYQWKADGADISNATNRTVTLSQNEIGKAITVLVSYTDDGGTLESVASDATSEVDATSAVVENLTFSTTNFDFVKTGSIESGYSAYSVIAAENGSFFTSRIIPDQTYQKYFLQFGLSNADNLGSTYKQYTSTLINGWSMGIPPKAVEVSDSQFAFVYVDDFGIKLSAFDSINGTATAPVILADKNTEQVSLVKVDAETLAISWYSSEGIHLTKFDLDTWSQANTTIITGNNAYSDLTILENGNIGVVYQGFSESEGVFSDIYFAELEAGSLDLLDVRLVNLNTLGWQTFPDVATDSSGNLFFAWQSQYEGSRSWDIVIRKFDVNTQTFGTEVIVNDHTKDSQDRPSIAISSSDKLVVTYGSDNYPDTGTYIQVFDENLIKLKSETFIVDNSPNTTVSMRVKADVSINLDEMLFVMTAAADNNGQPADILIWNDALHTLFNTLPSGSIQILGTAKETEKLTAVTDTLADADDPGAFSYQWLRDGTDIPGATASTYTLAQADVGAAISIRAGYTDGGGTAESVTSSEVYVGAVARQSG